ncbi:hypothetical protein G7085_13025 [Tessaracoccus sp. HDW20]|uniref:hypothetical protein n=1 Tax=Tessaracoccus coleopterorum TaxID=2714950 RepID=UPI0018D3A47F|nr:hypothetical protein [Tessaracoccus coleopterorum]NHB85239.1 hypothetical protein [Tessaracoccus coleopterorum]
MDVRGGPDDAVQPQDHAVRARRRAPGRLHQRPAPTGPLPTASPSPTAWPGRPGDLTSIDAVVFDGAFDPGYLRLAADRLTELHPTVTTTITPVTDVKAQVGDRFVEGPPHRTCSTTPGRTSSPSARWSSRS